MNIGTHCKNCIGTGLDMFNQACPCGIPPGTVGVVAINKPEPITIEDVKRLTVKRGEVLLVRLPDTSTLEQVHNFIRGLRNGFEGVMQGKVFVYRGDVEFTVLEFEPTVKSDSDYCGAV